jgi:hypothetical protein
MDIIRLAISLIAISIFVRLFITLTKPIYPFIQRIFSKLKN